MWQSHGNTAAGKTWKDMIVKTLALHTELRSKVAVQVIQGQLNVASDVDDGDAVDQCWMMLINDGNHDVGNILHVMSEHCSHHMLPGDGHRDAYASLHVMGITHRLHMLTHEDNH